MADADARLFAPHLPWAELTLHAAVHSGSASEAHITWSAPQARDVADWGCAAHAPSVRVVR